MSGSKLIKLTTNMNIRIQRDLGKFSNKVDFLLDKGTSQNKKEFLDKDYNKFIKLLYYIRMYVDVLSNKVEKIKYEQSNLYALYKLLKEHPEMWHKYREIINTQLTIALKSLGKCNKLHRELVELFYLQAANSIFQSQRSKQTSSSKSQRTKKRGSCGCSRCSCCSCNTTSVDSCN